MGHGDAGFDNHLIDINTLNSETWSHTKERGSVDNVLFENIYVLDGDDMADSTAGNFCCIRIYGHSVEDNCTNITVNDLFVLGKPITDENVKDTTGTVIGKSTENVHFYNTTPLPAEIEAITNMAD